MSREFCLYYQHCKHRIEPPQGANVPLKCATMPHIYAPQILCHTEYFVYWQAYFYTLSVHVPVFEIQSLQLNKILGYILSQKELTLFF